MIQAGPRVWFARGLLRALLALVATIAILWVSWRTSGTSWLLRIGSWAAVLVIVRLAQMALRRLSRTQGWDSSTPATTESVMLALGVAIGALLTTGMLGSSASNQMSLAPYDKPQVIVDPVPNLTAPVPAATLPTAGTTEATPPSIDPPPAAGTNASVVPESPSLPAATPPSEPSTASTSASSSPAIAPPPATEVRATVTVNTPAILQLPAAPENEGDPGAGSGELKVLGTEHGKATAIGSRAVVFLPEQDFTGAAIVTYEACDFAGSCSSGTIRLSVK